MANHDDYNEYFLKTLKSIDKSLNTIAKCLSSLPDKPVNDYCVSPLLKERMKKYMNLGKPMIEHDRGGR